MVLADYRMPEVNGLDFLEAAKRLHPDTVRILMSGFQDLDLAMEAIDRGAVFKFVRKPWDGDRLRAILEEAFNLHEDGAGYPRNRLRTRAEALAVGV